MEHRPVKYERPTYFQLSIAYVAIVSQTLNMQKDM